MLGRGILRSKRPWMVISALAVSIALIADPLFIYAEETQGELIEINEDEIWAQIDRDELRSSIDVDKIKEDIDRDELAESIDMEELKTQIDEEELSGQLSDEELEAKVKELRKTKELDAAIKELREKYPEVENLPEDYVEEEDENLFPIDEHPVDVTNVQLPPMSTRSPFDFIIDPLGLVYETDAARYGGGKVEKDAGILFRNSSGDYKFSSKSDSLTVTNKSNVPVVLTLNARIVDSGDVNFAESMYSMGDDSPSIFMALADDEGISTVMTTAGDSTVSLVLDAAPDDIYEYSFNEETGKYEYVMADGVDESVFSSYTFYITAECNKKANWDNVTDSPKVSVVWKTEPVLTDWDEVNAQIEAKETAEFELYKKYMLAELKAEKLEELKEARIDELFEEKTKQLLDEKFDELLQEKFEELKALKIKEKLEELNKDSEDEDAEETADPEHKETVDPELTPNPEQIAELPDGEPSETDVENKDSQDTEQALPAQSTGAEPGTGTDDDDDDPAEDAPAASSGSGEGEEGHEGGEPSGNNGGDASGDSGE